MNNEKIANNANTKMREVEETTYKEVEDTFNEGVCKLFQKKLNARDKALIRAGINAGVKYCTDLIHEFKEVQDE